MSARCCVFFLFLLPIYFLQWTSRIFILYSLTLDTFKQIHPFSGDCDIKLGVYKVLKGCISRELNKTTIVLLSYENVCLPAVCLHSVLWSWEEHLRGFADHCVSHCLESCNHGAQLDLFISSRGEPVSVEMMFRKKKHTFFFMFSIWKEDTSHLTYSISANLMSRPIRIAGGKSTIKQRENIPFMLHCTSFDMLSMMSRLCSNLYIHSLK